MICRAGCGACCIAPSISTAIPGMPNGKPAGERCIQLDDQNRCLLFGKPERPLVCGQFSADESVCGVSNADALATLIDLEQLTA
ncbi:YkgJ family cysteine cluster protein [Kistimonas asteriae]|uniref:YkgJ family cysteine cluster protein n=1 Tax=Kistimonas asteriae TaxID=517724 RepID=UPI001BA95B61|nr:YkgJ family cysteine cluster protein [Kistimonas asteriae]